MPFGRKTLIGLKLIDWRIASVTVTVIGVEEIFLVDVRDATTENLPTCFVERLCLESEINTETPSPTVQERFCSRDKSLEVPSEK